MNEVPDPRRKKDDRPERPFLQLEKIIEGLTEQEYNHRQDQDWRDRVKKIAEQPQTKNPMQRGPTRTSRLPKSHESPPVWFRRLRLTGRKDTAVIEPTQQVLRTQKIQFIE